ncbi:ADP-ribosyltransferase 1 precursor [Chrysochromulina tobinii]|uniref:NAD(P)(+)--arginine ADP-ribosyltransferase n=1 Tax=Chrysochromulina tobinii TaxID=1460289 RepID=A0A0M0LRD0_9EUKA|nr:ADP-ribosyltransferase 1 precursor [Chrysochromulina tobinii]|eukprot:KOO53615.1 ADP-ribosyltransferase 1 precursor [Chrysochromulina sp. CCMP291]
MALVHLSMAFWLSDGKPHIVVAWVSSAVMGLALLQGVATVAPSESLSPQARDALDKARTVLDKQLGNWTHLFHDVNITDLKEALVPELETLINTTLSRLSHDGSLSPQARDALDKARTALTKQLGNWTHLFHDVNFTAALYAYTEETPLYGTLNYTMRTPHTSSTPTDTELKRYADFLVHTEKALGSLPTHVSELEGKVYRGIKVLLNHDIYAPGKRITWQAFSSSTKKQTATLNFVNLLPGRKLSGSIFVIDSITAKDIRHFSAIPSEEEVLFPPNSQFKVEKVVTSEKEKKALLDQLSAYDMTDLDVYVLKQIA